MALKPLRLVVIVAVASFLLGGLAFSLVAAPALHLGAFAPAASAAKPSPSPNSRAAKAQQYCDAFIADLAGKLHVSVDTLKGDVKSALKDQVDKAVANKDLTAQQGDNLKKKIDAANGCQQIGRLPFGGRGAGFGAGFGLGQVMSAAATALGEPSVQQLQADLKAGKTLHQIADANHVTKDQFDQSVRAAATKALQPAVDSGKITAAQQTQAVNRIVAMADSLWDRTLPAGGMGGRGFFGRSPRPSATP